MDFQDIFGKAFGRVQTRNPEEIFKDAQELQSKGIHVDWSIVAKAMLAAQK
jgi:hypothetical protein